VGFVILKFDPVDQSAELENLFSGAFVVSTEILRKFLHMRSVRKIS